MSRQSSDLSPALRQRAHTTSFPSFSWRRPRSEQSTPQTSPPLPPQQPPLSIEGLIKALTPPAVPCLNHARSLATQLTTASPLPRRESLNPILIVLCTDSPTVLQAAGYDILSAYWENHESSAISTSERFSYLSLFLGGHTSWAVDLWEPRFKALRALTKNAMDVVGIESTVIKVLHWWIRGAFDGLAANRSERTERERSIDILVKFVNSILQNPENVSRISEEQMLAIMAFYASLVDSAIILASSYTPISPPTSSHPSPTHRRNLSSLSSSSIPSLNSHSQSQPDAPQKHSGEFAIDLYLSFLTLHLKILSAAHLDYILPLLFRSLAFCASPLPRLYIIPPRTHSRQKNTLEDKITETLSSLFVGPYSAKCMLILKQYLYPPSSPSSLTESSADRSALDQLRLSIMTALGAHRNLRNYVRRALSARLARAYISRETSMSYSHSGIPPNLELESELMEKAWAKDDYTGSSIGTGGNGWEAGTLGRALIGSVGAWVKFEVAIASADPDRQRLTDKAMEGRDEILEEAAGVLKDILQELDLKDDENAAMDEEEAYVVGATLFQLSGYLHPLSNADGSPYIIPLSHPNDAPTPILKTISMFLARDHKRVMQPPLSTILVHVAEHLTDADTSQLPVYMMEQHDLSPTSPEWLKNWKALLESETIMSPTRPLTRRGIMEALQIVYESVKDMTMYRLPLGDLVFGYCTRYSRYSQPLDDSDCMWRMLGEEIVQRTVEESTEGVDGMLDLLISVACTKTEENEETVETSSIYTNETHSPYTPYSSTVISPQLSRGQSESHPPSASRDRESGLPSLSSILSSIAGNGSRSQSVQPPEPEESVEEAPSLAPTTNTTSPSTPRDVSAVVALVEAFSQLTFTPYSLQHNSLLLAIRIYERLLDIMSNSPSVNARLTALQFLVRLRADRDHRLYFVSDAYDPNGLTHSLACLINRVSDPNGKSATDKQPDVESSDAADLRRARSRMPRDLTGRRPSRGRGAGPVHSAASRSRSRTAHTPVAPPIPLPQPPTKPVEPLWKIPDELPFVVSGVDSPSEVLVSYDPEGPNRILVLPISHYLQAVVQMLDRESSWDVLSYLLCHLPVQLSNKHLFCGPNSRMAISTMLSVMCTGIINGNLGSSIELWPLGLKARDAHGLAYQTLSVLISFKICLDLKQRHMLVETFEAGLNAQLSTIKCCLHALSLCAFELQPSLVRCLPRILEKLSQIMSNPNMAVHILGFIAITGSLPALYVNFTANDYKMVFGVALKYLQHYNRIHSHSSSSMAVSWALSQHVRILSYSAVYVWFLALKLPDRPRHISFITRQLLLANEDNTEVDGPTEVCFDWLSRYTYASADPRPANSVFSTTVMEGGSSSSDSTSEKTWIMGNSVVTIKSLVKAGWVEVISRRPSGYSKFICRVENVPMVGPGDVSPDLTSLAAGLVMERDPTKVTEIGEHESGEEAQPSSEGQAPGETESSVPDPITGYVWSKTAPSQRRKQVSIDPSFLLLQLSPFPDGSTEPYVKRVPENINVSRFFGQLDRTPVIDTHAVGIMYVAPGQTHEIDILRNTHGSPAYTRFLEGIGRLINLRGQVDVYAGGLDPDEDGEYAYAWWDDIGQILYHTATMMPTTKHDPQCNNKKRHIGNDHVRIVWNDSGLPYRFDTLTTEFQFVNIVIEPHSIGSIAAFSNNIHESEYFKVTMQLAPGMTEFSPIGHFKIISAENLPVLIRQLSLLSDWFAKVFQWTSRDTERIEMTTNWHNRLNTIKRFKAQVWNEDNSNQNGRPQSHVPRMSGGATDVMSQEALRDFTTSF
ncbi:hypothetical protein CVT24_004145 [Panaeolus cyanescens]|uniref:Rap-GAP domain-containing protein n=1 Tax=Panaeolus cyanescens TaxID=181874 RepID=A0A409Y6I0_9AGAR|nr:hypothetical protein CVT24_004145 [Panaeolus cyanescens]